MGGRPNVGDGPRVGRRHPSACINKLSSCGGHSLCVQLVCTARMYSSYAQLVCTARMYRSSRRAATPKSDLRRHRYLQITVNIMSADVWIMIKQSGYFENEN